MLQLDESQTRWSWAFLLLIFFADGAEDAADAKYMRRERREGHMKMPTTTLETTTQPIGGGALLAELNEAGEQQAAELSLLHGEAKAQFEREEEELQNLTNNQEVFWLGEFVPHNAIIKHIVDLPEGKTIDEVAAALDSASLLDQSYSAEEEAKKMARVEMSFRHYQQSAAELDRWLENFYAREDRFDEHGFEIDRMGMENRIQHVKKAMEKDRDDDFRAEQKSLIDMHRRDEERKKKHKANPGAALEEEKTKLEKQRDYEFTDAESKGNHGGDHAFLSGFFAKDRPNEERLDPSNMKVYKFHDYRLRYSHKHSYDVEVMWKRLPIAPKKVYRRKLAGAVRPDKDGYALVDQNGKELIFKQDYRGYYHQGNGLITKDDVLKVTEPVTWLQMHQRDKWHRKNDRYMIYPNYRTLIKSLIQQVNNKSLDQYSREDAVSNLEAVMKEYRIGAHMNHRKRGKAKISIEGMENFLCGINAEISKVTVRKLKERIENKTGIPVEAQKLLMGLEELNDEDLLNKRIPPIGIKLNLIRKDWKQTRDGLRTRRQREYERRQAKYKKQNKSDASLEKKQIAGPLHSSSNETRIAEHLDDLRAFRSLRIHQLYQSSPAGGGGAGFISKRGNRHSKFRHHKKDKGAVMKNVRRQYREAKNQMRRQENKQAGLEEAALLEKQHKANVSASVSSHGRMSRLRLEEMHKTHVAQGRDHHMYELLHHPEKYREITRLKENFKKDKAAALTESAVVKTNSSNKATPRPKNIHLFPHYNGSIPHHSSQYSSVDSVVQFVRGRDGKMHVAKEIHATANHSIPKGFTFGKIDDGVSLLDRIEKEK